MTVWDEEWARPLHRRVPLADLNFSPTEITNLLEKIVTADHEAGFVRVDTHSEDTARLVAAAICRGQNVRPLHTQDEMDRRQWLAVADCVLEALRDGVQSVVTTIPDRRRCPPPRAPGSALRHM